MKRRDITRHLYRVRVAILAASIAAEALTVCGWREDPEGWINPRKPHRRYTLDHAVTSESWHRAYVEGRLHPCWCGHPTGRRWCKGCVRPVKRSDA